VERREGPMIVLRGLSKRFGRNTVLHGAGLHVRRGEIVAVTGPSGAGKTTLLRLVAGLARPDAGEILLNGSVVSSPRRLVPPHRRRVALAMQHPALWPHMSVRGHLEFVLGALPRAEADRRIGTHLGALELDALAHRQANELSGGEARRLSLARALAFQPAVLLLDEPLTHLDPDLRTAALAHISATVEEASMAVLLVSHRAEEVREIVHRIVRIEGSLLVDGPAPPVSGREGPDGSLTP